MSPLPRLICTGSIAAFLLGTVAQPPEAKAAILYWGGDTSSSWATNTNWLTSTGATASLPAGGNDIAVFNYSDPRPFQVGTLGSSRAVGSLIFRSTTPITLGLATQTLTINASTGDINGGGTGSEAITIDAGSAAHTIAANLTLRSAYTGAELWTNNSNSLFKVTGATSLAPEVLNLQFAGSGTGGFKFDGNVNVATDGVTFTNDMPNAAVTIGAGATLNLNSSALSPFQFSLAGAGAFAIDGLISHAGDNTLNLNGTGTQTINNIDLSNSVTNRVQTISVGAGSLATVTGVISNGASTASALTKSGAGKLTLTGANTFTGTLTINDGTLAVSGAGELASNTVNFLTTAGTLGTPVLEVNTNLRFPVNTSSVFTLNYGTSTGGNVGNGASINGTGQITAAGTISLNVNDSDTVAEDLVVNVPIVNDGTTARAVVKNGRGTLVMNAANSFTGTFQVSQGTAIIRVSPANTAALVLIPSTANTDGSGTTVVLESGVTYGLNSSLVTGGTGTFFPGTQIIGAGELALSRTTSINPIIRTFTVGDNTAQTEDLTIWVPVVNGTNNSALWKDGPGQLRMKAENTYTGATAFFRGNTIIDYSTSAVERLSDTGDIEPRGGTLTLLGNASANVVENVGALSPGGSNVLGGSFALNSTTASSGGSSTINLQSQGGKSYTLVFSGVRFNPGGGVVTLNAGLNTAFRTTAANNDLGMLGISAFVNGRWIANDGTGAIVQHHGTTQNNISLWQPNQSIEVTGPTSGSLLLNRIGALTFSGNNSTVALDGVGNFSNALTISSSGILVAPEAANKTLQITGGRLLSELPYATAAASGLLITNNGGAGSVLKITSRLGSSDSPLGNVQQLTIAGNGVVELAGKMISVPTYNQSTRLFGQVNVMGGATLRVSGAKGVSDAISDYLPVNLGLNGDTGGTLDLNGSPETIGGLLNAVSINQGSTLGTVSLGTGGKLTLNQNLAANYSGSITGSGTLIKQGNATLNLAPAVSGGTTGVLDFTGSLEIHGGLVAFIGTNGSIRNGMTNVGNILIRGGELQAQLSLSSADPQNLSMIKDDAVITLEGTTGSGLRVNNTNQGAVRVETVGQLVLNAGANVITLDTTNTVTTVGQQLTMSNATNGILRTAGSGTTLLMRGTNLGTTATNIQRSFVTVASGAVANLGLVGGSTGSGTTTMSILPYAIGASTPASTSALALDAVGDSFVTYQGTTGFRPLTASEYTTYASAAANSNVSASAALSGLTGKTINSLRLDTAATPFNVTGSSGELVITSGALLLSAAGTTNDVILGGFTAIKPGTGTKELVVHVTTTAKTTPTPVVFPNPSPATTAADAVLEIASPIADNGTGNPTSLTKSGNGTLLLSSAGNTFTGNINVNQGVLAFKSGTLGFGTKIRMAGGTLRWDSNSTNITLGKTIELVGPSSYFTPTGTGAGGNQLARGNTFDVDTNNVTLTNSIGAGGVGGLVKVGTGTLTLNAAPDYKGATVVTRGTMNFAGGINANTTSGLFLTTENPLVQGKVEVSGTPLDVLLPLPLTGADRVAATVTGTLNVNQLLVGGAFTNPLTTSPTANMTNDSNAELTVSNGTTVTIGNGGGDSFLIIGYRDEGAANGAVLSNGATNPTINNQTYTIVGPSPALRVPSATAKADFSKATSVNIDVARILVGQNKGSGSVRTDGDLTLSEFGTNNVTAGIMVIGNSPGPDSTGTSNGLVSNVALGRGTNNFNVDSLTVGGQNGNGNLVLGGDGTFKLRDRSGVGGADLFIGDNDDITNTTQSTSATRVDLISGTVDVKLNELVIGRHGGNTSSAATTGGGQGGLDFGSGTFEAQTVKLGITSNRGTSYNPSLTGANIRMGGFVSGVISKGTFRFGDMSQGIGSKVDFNWNAGTMENIPGYDAVNHNVSIFLGTSAQEDHFFNIEAGRTMTFEAAAILKSDGGFIKNGAGTLVLNGDNTYSGETIVNQGKLVANSPIGSSGSSTGTNFVLVNNGAELAGNGRIMGAGGAFGASVEVSAGGKVNPGPGTPATGKLTLGGDLLVHADAILHLEINTVLEKADQIVIGDVANGITGALLLDPDGDPLTSPILEIVDIDRTFFVGDKSLTLLTYTPEQWDGGLFKVPLLGGGFKLINDYNPLNPNPADTFTIYNGTESNTFWIDYNAGEFKDQLALIAVPEPGALASLLGGLGMLMGLQRFRRSSRSER